MKCPIENCGAWTLVKETRTQPDGNVRRIRECANEHRLTTVELVATIRPKKHPYVHRKLHTQPA